MYETILFDLDGTIIDSEEGIINSAIYALAKFGINTADRSSLRKFIGPPLHRSFELFYGFSAEKAALAVDFYREYYADKGVFEYSVYDGMELLFKKLKSEGKTLVLATSKYEYFAKKVIEHLGFSDYFDFIAGSCKNGERSEKAEVISYVLRSLKITDKQKVLMIGDRMHDIIGAGTVGIDSIGVLYGFGNYNELSENGATYIAQNAEDIYRFIMA